MKTKKRKKKRRKRKSQIEKGNLKKAHA